YLVGALVLLREHGRPVQRRGGRRREAIAQPLTQAVNRVSVRPRGRVPPPLPSGGGIVGPDGTAEAISPRRARGAAICTSAAGSPPSIRRASSCMPRLPPATRARHDLAGSSGSAPSQAAGSACLPARSAAAGWPSSCEPAATDTAAVDRCDHGVVSA